MALFKSRKGAEEAAAAAAPPESIEALRRRARHRLVGAVVLVLVGVIGFPVLFDTQPRPIPVDIPIEIPDRNKVKPLALPAAPAPAASGVAGVVAMAQPAASAVAAPASAEAVSAKAAPALARNEETAAKPEPKPPAAVEPKAEPKPEPTADDGARAQALLEGKLLPPPEGDGRFVVQVGAFADPAKARETRLRVERAGLKTYTHVAETKEGRRIRVRVGPFSSRAEADQAAQKIKGLDLPAAILAL